MLLIIFCVLCSRRTHKHEMMRCTCADQMYRRSKTAVQWPDRDANRRLSSLRPPTCCMHLFHTLAGKCRFSFFLFLFLAVIRFERSWAFLTSSILSVYGMNCDCLFVRSGVYVCVCECMWICVNVGVYVYICICTPTYMFIYVRIYIHMYMCIYICI